MATAQPSPAHAQERVPCPDPSAHTKDSKLQEQASTAALYVTNPNRSHSTPHDSKLSSAGAAASLKYARPQDLPSFPVVGIDTQGSGLTAATLATANPKSIERWKPSQSESAGKAALLAQDYKMSPSWQPVASAAGSKAALLAHKEGAKVNSWTPEASKNGNTAADIAFRKKGLSPQAESGFADEGHRRALIAATGAFSGSRKRADSTPVAPAPSYPDSSNSKRNALNAATLAHRPSQKAVEKTTPLSPRADAARIQNIGRNVAREMFTEAPPVSIEVEEKKHQDALRASAISMAKQMYSVQQAHINEVSANYGRAPAPTAAALAHNDRQPSISSEEDLKQQAMQYINLQEAAQKLAAERLAKIKTDDAAAFRDYYGYKKEPRRRLSVKLTRRRASSEGEMVDSDDEERSRRIRKQMSVFNNRLAEVDAKKRQKDREALLAVAQKKVEAQMHTMDEKLFAETGKVSQSLMEEWDAKARAKAAAASESRMANHGKVHIGGGKYLDQSEIDAVATARVQPTLQHINEKAEQRRARDEEVRLDQEEKRRQAKTEKERGAELKAEERRIKSEEKQAAKTKKAEERAAARTERSAEAAKHAEEAKLKQDEERKSQEITNISSPEPTHREISAPETEHKATTELPSTSAEAKTDDETAIAQPSRDTERRRDTLLRKRSSNSAKDVHMRAGRKDSSASPPMSPTSKKSFKKFLSKFKRRSKQPDSGSEDSSPTKSSFVGGHALTGAGPESHSSHHRYSSPPAIGNPTSFTRVSGSDPYVIRATTSPSVSSLSSDDWEAHRAAGRPGFNRAGSGLSRSEVSDDDEFEEARDAFDEKLAPPPKFVASEGRVSPVRETIFREEL